MLGMLNNLASHPEEVGETGRRTRAKRMPSLVSDSSREIQLWVALFLSSTRVEALCGRASSGSVLMVSRSCMKNNSQRISLRLAAFTFRAEAASSDLANTHGSAGIREVAKLPWSLYAIRRMVRKLRRRTAQAILFTPL